MKIELWGLGGEIVVGTITREQYVYWRLRADEDDIIAEELLGHLEDDISPELKLGPWYDLDDLIHESGPAIDGCRIRVFDDVGSVLWEGDLSALASQVGLERLAEQTEEFYFVNTDHRYGFLAYDAQKGMFESYTVEGVNEWDPRQLKVYYAKIEDNTIVTGIKYADKDLKGDGVLETTSKSWDWRFIVNGDKEDEQG